HNVYCFHTVYGICSRFAAAQRMVCGFYNFSYTREFGGLSIVCFERKVSLIFSPYFVPWVLKRFNKSEQTCVL
ncbi:MAG: hypothetical protein KAH97_10270, partial [Anaerolineales bacterium]|nr:hypothetical protein [Anaerolineales bacterium]